MEQIDDDEMNQPLELFVSENYDDLLDSDLHIIHNWLV